MGALIYFYTLFKICYKMQTLTCNLIASIYGTNEENIKMNSCAIFTVNLMNIQGVMSIYSHQKDQTSVTTSE